MRKKVTILLAVICVALIPLAYFAGLRVAGKRLEERGLQSLADTMEYNSAIYNAASYGQLLLDAREGKTNAVIQRLEQQTDVWLLWASAKTNAVVQGIPKGPWADLKKDRLAHPRQTSADREKRISSFLDTVISESPNKSVEPTRALSSARGSP
jgi:hypothetical protein